MSWFFIALWAPFLLACANHNDKFLLSRYLKDENIGAIVIFSSLFSGVAIPIVLLIQPDVYDVSLVQGSALVATGMLGVVAAVCYLYALDIDEASFVTPFYQTVPIFAYFLGYFILGETITLAQGLGSFVIIVGALALSLEFGRRGNTVQAKRCGIDAGGFLPERDKWRHFQADRRGDGFLGVAFLGFRRPGDGRFDHSGLRPQLPQRFPRPLQTTESRRIGLIALSRTLFSVSEAVTFYATLLAPVALVLVVNSFQPLFVFMLGIVLTLLFPRVAEESLDRRKMLQKGVGIGLMLVGGYLISR